MANGKRHALLILFCFVSAAAAGADRLTMLVSFNADKIGPGVACDGEFRLQGGGELVLSEWCHDRDDRVEGTRFKLTTWHSARTAQAANVPVVYTSVFPKGLLIETTATAQATIDATTTLGDFRIELASLQKTRQMDFLGGRLQVQWIPNVERVTGSDGEEEYASLATLNGGQPAIAYVAWDGQQDRVCLRSASQTQTVTPSAGEYLDPRSAYDGNGRLWIVWAASDGSQWDLWTNGPRGPVRLTTNPRNDFWPRLACDKSGAVWLAWQSVGDDLHYEVMLAPLGAAGLGSVVNVSESSSDDWEPALCSTADGRIAVAWDTYRNGSYDVYLRQFRLVRDSAVEPQGKALAVAATARREAHATLAADSSGRLWVAWDESFEDWGKHPKKPGTLHSQRTSSVACLNQGQLQFPAAELMEAVGTGPAGRFVEYPQVAVDGHDRLWVVFRVENQIEPRYSKRRAQRYGMWHLFATQYDGQQWTRPMLLARSNGRQDVRVDTALNAAGDLLVAYGADGRTARLPYVPVDYDVVVASLSGHGVPAKPLQLKNLPGAGSVDGATPDPELGPLPRTWTVGGKTYRLVIGDTHRHTDISRCGNGYDGSLQDAYRYALNASGLDWLAISDHDQDILKHRNDRNERPRQNYDWWRSQKSADLYTIPGRFVALYGYEHGGSYQARGGHKNIINATRTDVEEVDEPHALFAALADSGAIAIPHQLADGGSRVDWEKWNGQYERVAEIFQARGSYEFAGCPRSASIFTEGQSMWDALSKGIRIGIIASSDHGQTHQARAGVYVLDEPPGEIPGAEGFSRQGILEAIRARRAFGATVAAAVQMSIGGRPLGQEIEVDGAPTIEASVSAPAPIRRLDVVRDNRFVYTSTPGQSTATLRFHDMDLQPGSTAYYYVRAEIGEEDYAWSSPLWVSRR